MLKLQDQVNGGKTLSSSWTISLKRHTQFAASWCWANFPLKLEETNEQLSALASEPDTLSAQMSRAIQRHAELFQDNARELRRTKVCAEH